MIGQCDVLSITWGSVTYAVTRYYEMKQILHSRHGFTSSLSKCLKKSASAFFAVLFWPYSLDWAVEYIWSIPPMYLCRTVVKVPHMNGLLLFANLLTVAEAISALLLPSITTFDRRVSTLREPVCCSDQFSRRDFVKYAVWVSILGHC